MIKWKETILTGGTEEFVNPNNPKLGSEVEISLKVYKENPIETVLLRIAPNGEQINILMVKKLTDEFYDVYSCRIKISTQITNYRFALITKSNFYWYNAKEKLRRTTPSDIHDFKIIADMSESDWITKSIFYQIFPDRFFDGDPSNNVKTGEYTWHGVTSREKSWNDIEFNDNYRSYDFYGGDLAGVKQKISYFKSLGVNSIYLNPIFHAPSNHKYDIVDYKTVDKHFGSNEEFAQLVDELHKNNFKIILDGIFNHTGEGHKWFNKLGIFEKEGAFDKEDSPYHDFYIFYDWPNNYETWFGFKSLPKLNYNSDKLRAEIYRNPDSVMKYWLTEPYNIDGWRVDVANMMARQDETQIHGEIWEEVRQEIKSCKPSAYLLGEHFYDGTPLLDGKKLDAVMNYQGFNFPLLKWLTKEELTYVSTDKGLIRKLGAIKFNAKDFRKQLNQFRTLIPFQLQLLSFNLLGSHDTPRFYTRLKENKDQYKLAIIFLFTYIGVPSVYYGDEIGMKGSFDPDNRRPMIWNESKWDQIILNLYKTFIKLRSERIELQKGLFKELYTKNEVYAFARIESKNITIVILNNNKNKEQIDIPCWKIGFINDEIEDFLTGNVFTIKDGSLIIEIENHKNFVLISRN